MLSQPYENIVMPLPQIISTCKGGSESIERIELKGMHIALHVQDMDRL